MINCFLFLETKDNLRSIEGARGASGRVLQQKVRDGLQVTPVPRNHLLRLRARRRNHRLRGPGKSFWDHFSDIFLNKSRLNNEHSRFCFQTDFPRRSDFWQARVLLGTRHQATHDVHWRLSQLLTQVNQISLSQPRPLEFLKGFFLASYRAYESMKGPRGLRRFRKTHMENILPSQFWSRDPRYPKGVPRDQSF